MLINHQLSYNLSEFAVLMEDKQWWLLSIIHELHESCFECLFYIVVICLFQVFHNKGLTILKCSILISNLLTLKEVLVLKQSWFIQTVYIFQLAVDTLALLSFRTFVKALIAVVIYALVLKLIDLHYIKLLNIISE